MQFHVSCKARKMLGICFEILYKIRLLSILMDKWNCAKLPLQDRQISFKSLYYSAFTLFLCFHKYDLPKKVWIQNVFQVHQYISVALNKDNLTTSTACEFSVIDEHPGNLTEVDVLWPTIHPMQKGVSKERPYFNCYGKHDIIRKSIPQLVILQNFSVVAQKDKMLQLFEIRKICMEKTVKARPASLSCFWYILNAYNSALI